MDVHIPAAITRALRARGIEVITAQEDGMRERPDVEILERAGDLAAAVVTMDRDFVVEASRRQRAGIPFTGIIYITDAHMPVALAVGDLALIAEVYEPADIAGRVEYLPL